MQSFIGIDPDMAAYGRAVKSIRQAETARAAARRLPLVERVAEAMQEIAAVRGSCDEQDLTLRFAGETLTPDILAAAQKLAGRRSTSRIG